MPNLSFIETWRFSKSPTYLNQANELDCVKQVLLLLSITSGSTFCSLKVVKIITGNVVKRKCMLWDDFIRCPLIFGEPHSICYAGETHMLGGVSYMSVSQDIIFLSRYTKQPMHSTIFQKILNYIEEKMDEGTTKVYTHKIWNSSYGNCNWAAFQPPQMLYI